MHATATDTEPFQVLFMSHYAFVCRTLAHFGVESAAVEDVAQDVFMVLHRRFDDFDPSRDARSWLWGIARRVAHTHRRGVTRAERKRLEAEPPAAPPGPERALEVRERAAIVEDVLRRMPAKLRDVFVLAEIEGLAVPEIAGTLEIKLNTAYSRLRLARERFGRAVERLRARDEGPRPAIDVQEDHG